MINIIYSFSAHPSFPALNSKTTSISQNGVLVFQEMAAGRPGDQLEDVHFAERATTPHQISVENHAMGDHIDLIGLVM